MSHSHPALTPIVLAYSGGLDTSFLVPWLAEQQQRPVITVTVDTGGIDTAQRARWPSARARSAPSPTTRWMRAPTTSSRCCAFSSWATCAAASSIRCASAPSASCRRRPSRAWRASCIGHRGARLHRRRQRPGALRGRAAHARPGSQGAGAGARPRVQAPGRAGLPAGAGPAAATQRRALLDQPRPVGRHHRRPRDADLGRQHPGRCLAADARGLHAAARARAPHAQRSRGPAGRARWHGHRPRGDHRGA